MKRFTFTAFLLIILLWPVTGRAQRSGVGVQDVREIGKPHFHVDFIFLKAQNKDIATLYSHAGASNYGGKPYRLRRIMPL